MLFNITRSTVLAQGLRIADTFHKRFRGLMLQKEHSQGEALLIVPCKSVHMFFMRFSLDVVFVDAQWRVVGLEENLCPWKVSRMYPRAHMAIELPAGTLKNTGTQLGDTLALTPSDV